MDPLDTLDATIRARRSADPATSYVARLFAGGRATIAQKVGEEAVETVIAACREPDKLVPEAADLVFHLLVLLHDAGASLDDVRAELARREGTGGLVEKAARPAEPAPRPLSSEPTNEAPLGMGSPLPSEEPR